MASRVEDSSSTVEDTLWLRRPLKVMLLDGTYVLKVVEVADDAFIRIRRKETYVCRLYPCEI